LQPGRKRASSTNEMPATIAAYFFTPFVRSAGRAGE
jgi:hypothetical protein